MRPLGRLDVSTVGAAAEVGDGAGVSVMDVLAPVSSAWGTEGGVARGEGGGGSPAGAGVLGDLAERAGVQVAVLRGALDEAVRLDRALASRVTEAARRLEQGARFEQEMDRRLAAAGRAGEIIEQAGAALRALERVVEQLKGTRAGLESSLAEEIKTQESRVRARLAEHEARIEAMIARHADAAAERLAEHTAALDRRLNEVSDLAVRALEGAQVSAAAAESQVRHIGGNIERNVRAEADRLAAALERQGAQVQARVEVVIDGAQQRITEIEQRAERLGSAAEARMESISERAAAVLGGSGAWQELESGESLRDGAGGLSAVVQRAEAAAREGDDAVVRLSVASERAVEAEVKLTAALAEAAKVKMGQQVLEDVRAAEERLVSLRDDLESMATSVRYNLTQAQQSEAILAKTVERARDKVQGLDRAMDQVTDQAASMVQVAREVAGLVMRAEGARRELMEVIGAAEDQGRGGEDPTAGRVGAGGGAKAAGRRPPFGPPRAHGEEGDSAGGGEAVAA